MRENSIETNEDSTEGTAFEITQVEVTSLVFVVGAVLSVVAITVGVALLWGAGVAVLTFGLLLLAASITTSCYVYPAVACVVALSSGDAVMVSRYDDDGRTVDRHRGGVVTLPISYI